jgi:translation initiation factor 3 subunit F
VNEVVVVFSFPGYYADHIILHYISIMSQCTPALLLWEENAAAAAASVAVAPTAPTPAVTQLVIVHPLVLLHVLDHHTRRQNAEGRVIGTLLGRRDGNKVSVFGNF